jgi:hypothetical protein
VVVIAGTITLYNQAKFSAGNAKAQQRVLRASNVIETFAAESGGNYPTLDQLRLKWKAVSPDDTVASPWGGTGGDETSWTKAAGTQGIIEVFEWPQHVWRKELMTARDAPGLLAYGLNPPGATQSAINAETGITKVYSRYVIGIYNSRGVSPYYPMGN